MRELTPELRAIYELARAAQGAHEPRDLLDRVCRCVADIFGFERVAVSRYAPERGEVVPLYALGVPDEALEALPTPIDSWPLLRRALEAEVAVFVEDVAEDPVIPPDVVEAFGIRSVLAVPLISLGRCLGFIGAERAGKAFVLRQDQLDLLTTIGALTAAFLERALEREELRRLDELKSHFIELASHELRAPASVIHGISATLHLRGDHLRADQLYQLRRTLYEQTERMRRLVDQLLDLSRLEANAIRIVLERFRVRTRVEELVLTMAGERAPDVSIEIPSDLEAVADAHAFDRIVSNLITNAFRYGAAPVRVAARQADRHFRLTVEDEGQGVPPEFVPLLFERFTRGEPARDSIGGAGLGLSIAQSYAQAQGGELLYERAEPRGARFQLVLPSPPAPERV